jgi:hypothetical protein
MLLGMEAQTLVAEAVVELTILLLIIMGQMVVLVL